MSSSFFLYFLPLILAVVVFGGLYIVWKHNRKRALSTYRKEYYRKKLIACKDLSNRETIIELDNILSHILREFGYQGNLADQLRKKPFMLRDDLEETWRLHKLRNRIVHELDVGRIDGEDVRIYFSIIARLLD